MSKELDAKCIDQLHRIAVAAVRCGDKETLQKAIGKVYPIMAKFADKVTANAIAKQEAFTNEYDHILDEFFTAS